GLTTEAIQGGQVKSLLTPSSKALLYIVVFPSRCDQLKQFSRSEFFADGWVAHMSAVCQTAMEAGAGEDLLCLLWFLNIDACDGALVVGYDGRRGRLSRAELIDTSGGESSETSERSTFSLAAMAVEPVGE